MHYMKKYKKNPGKKNIAVFFAIFSYLMIAPVFSQVATTDPQNESGGGSGSQTPRSMAGFSPAMDNKLKAPSSNESIGLFGLNVIKVERMLRDEGAVMHSYAFGKYSKLRLAGYNITLFFDKERNLGKISIFTEDNSDMPAYVRKVFTDYFLQGASLQKFALSMLQNGLEISYLGD